LTGREQGFRFASKIEATDRGGNFWSRWNFSFPRRGYRDAPCGTDAIYEEAMLNLVVTLLIIALIAAVLGFGGIAGAAVGIAKIVFFVALVLFLVGAIAGSVRGPAL
jgi:uncharacterized membrane protein YtjA (UPF0391 family)